MRPDVCVVAAMQRRIGLKPVMSIAKAFASTNDYRPITNSVSAYEHITEASLIETISLVIEWKVLATYCPLSARMGGMSPTSRDCVTSILIVKVCRRRNAAVISLSVQFHQLSATR